MNATTTKPGNIFVISAPSGAGKSSLVKALCALDSNIKVSISHTTRSKRSTEIEGQDYYFVTQATFDEMKNSSQFLEYAYVYGNYYGTSINTVKNCLAQGRDVILEIDWQGALQVKNIFPQAVLIFILPPSITELESRLKARNTDSIDVILQRLAAAETDMSHAKDFQFNIINNDFNSALHDIYSIILNSRKP